tara:strand:+ start:3979 stop:4416 length:438 start_codon:yes stop_codon:yes gene_type:complete
MKKSEIKNMLKPLIRECIREELLSNGLLSGVISEVVKGFQGSMVAESIIPASPPSKQQSPLVDSSRHSQDREKSLQEQRERLLSSIGKDSFNGVDIFENVTPAAPEPSSASSMSSPLSGEDPGDPGVDISGIVAVGGNHWKDLIR